MLTLNSFQSYFDKITENLNLFYNKKCLICCFNENIHTKWMNIYFQLWSGDKTGTQWYKKIW